MEQAATQPTMTAQQADRATTLSEVQDLRCS